MRRRKKQEEIEQRTALSGRLSREGGEDTHLQLPQNRITDHRVGLTLHKLALVLRVTWTNSSMPWRPTKGPAAKRKPLRDPQEALRQAEAQIALQNIPMPA